MQSIAETCVRFDAAHLSINLVSEIAVSMFPTLNDVGEKYNLIVHRLYVITDYVTACSYNIMVVRMQPNCGLPYISLRNNFEVQHSSNQ